jgi:hypothetical protein
MSNQAKNGRQSTTIAWFEPSDAPRIGFRHRKLHLL